MPGLIQLHPGARVRHHGVLYQITRVVNVEQVLARDPNGRTSVLPVAELGPGDEPEPAADPAAGARADRPRRDLAQIDDAQWAVALARDRIIAPLRDRPDRTRDDVKAAAAAVRPAEARAATGGRSDAVSATSVYRWLVAFERTGTVSSLVPNFAARGHRGSHLPPEVDAIVADVLDRVPRERAQRGEPPPTLGVIYAAVGAACEVAGLPTPNVTSVRLRAAAHAESLRLRRGRPRGGPPRPDEPGAACPLAEVQIDHTQLDLECVSDDERRTPVGRPWITVAIDVFSRMILGFILGLDPPSAHRVGLCLAQALLGKEDWLAARGLTTRWPCWGRPKMLKADNAKEFRGEFLQRACEEYQIHLQWRAVARPNYGAHIERWLGVMLGKVHELPGTTFSNPAARGDYDSRRHASLTVAEAERVLARWVTGVYHERRHAGLGGDTPLSRWEAGCLRGFGGHPPTGLPAREPDARQVTLDFLPFIKRSVQSDGVQFHNVRYYSDVLRPYADARDKGARRHLFRHDPRVGNVLYFREPEQQTYYDVPTADPRHPRVSGYELEEAARQLRKARLPVDEASIFAQIRQMREEVEAARRHTRAARRGGVQANRTSQRRRDHERVSVPAPPRPATPTPEATLGVEDASEAADARSNHAPSDAGSGRAQPGATRRARPGAGQEPSAPKSPTSEPPTPTRRIQPFEEVDDDESSAGLRGWGG